MLNFIWFNIKNLGVNTKYVLHSDLNTAKPKQNEFSFTRKSTRTFPIR